jgi:predicted phosphodiesterase
MAISDIHIDHPANRPFVDGLRPESDSDWLIVCGDVSDSPEDLDWAMSVLSERFERVIWVPGNHELLAQRSDGPALRGVNRYNALVEICRDHGVITPEDPYLVWTGQGGPATIIPLFVLYDYSFGSNIATTKREAMALAHDAGVVCVDEFLLDPSPHATREHWCHDRVAISERRMQSVDPDIPTVLINHFPLIREPTEVLFHPEFAQWCGTDLTADWHIRFRAAAVVYGHLHIPRTTIHDDVPFTEVSLGYPRERSRYARHEREIPRTILGGEST